MEGERTDRAFVEGVEFYKDRPFRVVIKDTLIVFFCFVLLTFFIAWAVADAGARRAHKEARDIRTALISVGAEYYSDMGSIYDPSNPDGLADGAADRIAKLSTRNGEVILYSWDDTSNMPLQFEYRTGMYRVIYTDTSITNSRSSIAEGDFVVYYSFELLKFEAE